MNTSVSLIAVIFLSCSIGVCQDTQYRLTVDQPVERDIEPGASHSYAISLKPGDYVAGSIEQHGGPVITALFQPEGLYLRDFPGSPDGKSQFSFIAEVLGTYRLVLTSPARAGKYELQLTKKLSLDERLNRVRHGQEPTPRPDKYSCEAIEALLRQIAGGDKRTEAFWQQVTRSGTPLVEPFRKDRRYQLVTFLWRGSIDTRNVLVSGSFTKQPITDYLLTQLADTDVWYLTVKVPSGARFVYGLSTLSDVLESNLMRGEARGHRDPLNPNLWLAQSMAELPGAVPQPWIVKQSFNPEGKVDQHRIKSEFLKNERSIWVYTPPGYRADGKPCALLVIFDGDAYIDPVPTPVILDNLIAASKIPPTVAVLVANPSRETRTRELTPNPNFADFLAKELVPWTRAHYNITMEPRQTVVAGSSLGGIAAAYAGLRHPEVFGNVLSQSGAFSWAPDHSQTPEMGAFTEPGWLPREYIKRAKLPLKFYIDAGVFEVDSAGDGGGILESSRQMRDVLLAKGYEVHYQQFVGGHDYLSWRGTLADGLLALIGKKEGRNH
jgi:enterochelin esterase-like enzyme